MSANISEKRSASYCYFFFCVVRACGRNRIITVELQSFLQSYTKRAQQFFVRPFLAVHTGDFFYPANPPIIILLHDGSVNGVHFYLFRNKRNRYTSQMIRPRRGNLAPWR
ncbi:hypothetical protein THIOKS11580020 [Thiocapsa sp. KS1]|nr:hypothetical protein THIOKS11580020 [Thiocapsa sp. KS1]